MIKLTAFPINVLFIMLKINDREGINADWKGPSDKMLLIRWNMEPSSAALFVDNGRE